MKRSAVLALVFLIIFSAVSALGGSTKKVARANQTEGGDSLLAAAETTGTFMIPTDKTLFGWLCATDESTTVAVQIRPRGGSTWFTFGTLDTIPAAATDTVKVNNLAAYGGWEYRLIFDDIEATNSEYWYCYERSL